MVRIKKMEPVKSCHLSPSYLLNCRRKKVGQSLHGVFVFVRILKYLSKIRLISSSSGKPTEGNSRLYRAACLFLTIICLILLLVVIILSVKREYLQPWIMSAL